MKILITESRLYNAFKNWMDGEIELGIYKWIHYDIGDIWLVDKNGYGYIWYNFTDGKFLNIYRNLYDEIYGYFPLEKNELLKLFKKYFEETLNSEVNDIGLDPWEKFGGW